MFKKKFFRSSWKHRGQAMVLYALLIPILFLFVGVGIDFGWYFLNVSRLQNAADAAALAGAWKIVRHDNSMKDYYVPALVDPPDDITVYEKMYVLSNTSVSGYTEETIQTELGYKEARWYANKNLSRPTSEPSENLTAVTNEWSTDETLSNVTFSAALYARDIDKATEERTSHSANGIKYYKVTLTEKISHLFLQGLDPMEAQVVAYAVLKLHEQDFVTTIEGMRKDKGIINWEYQNYYMHQGIAAYTGKWNHYQDSDISYTAGSAHRVESKNISPSTAVGTSANNAAGNKNTIYSEDEVDSINLDFRAESVFGGTYNGVSSMATWDFDWDLRSELPEGVTRKAAYNTGWYQDSNDDLRIIASFNFTSAWKDRDPDDFKADILWTTIESEPMWFKMPFHDKDQPSMSSVRQIVLNVKASNTATATKNDENGNSVTYYTQRPFFIIYTGPEVNDTENTVRQSQPVILNLYADWNAILYMPNSPVIINGNGYKLNGFVIAKEYHRLAKDTDYTADNEYVEVTDSYGHRIFVKEDYLLDEDEVEADATAEFGEVDKNINGANGNIFFVKKIASEEYHPIISITKAESKNYSDFTAYIAATYKSNFMAATGLSESELSRITFPQEENNGEEEYVVETATANFSDTPKDGYVKVIVNGDTTAPKYIDKRKLPYIKIRRNNVRPYVSVYDLKKKKVGTFNTGTYAGVTITDDSISATGTSTQADLWNKDDRSVVKALLEGTYDKKYIESELSFLQNNGMKYFVFKTDLDTLVEYRRVTTKDGGEVRYIREHDKTYYMETVPEGATGKNAQKQTISNPIITDNLGDLQTVKITPPQVLAVTDKASNNSLPMGDSSVSKYFSYYTRETNSNEQPIDRGTSDNSEGNYRRTSVGHSDNDYKIPALERVYYPQNTYDLSTDSRYSYFNISNLKRVNYTYMNVDELNNLPEGKSDVKDMFFTTKRASWID